MVILLLSILVVYLSISTFGLYVRVKQVKRQEEATQKLCDASRAWREWISKNFDAPVLHPEFNRLAQELVEAECAWHVAHGTPLPRKELV